MFKNKRDRQTLLSQVHPDEVSLAKAAAVRWTVENLGQSWPEVMTTGQLLEMHMDGCGGDSDMEAEREEALAEEYKYWHKEARAFAAEINAKKLPLTLESMELAFDGKLP